MDNSPLAGLEELNEPRDKAYVPGEFYSYPERPERERNDGDGDTNASQGWETMDE